MPPAQYLRVVCLLACLLLESVNSAAANETALKDLTEKDCEEFGQSLIAAIQSGNLDECARYYDVDGFIGRMIGDLEFHYVAREQVIAQWQQLARESHVLYKGLVDVVAQGGTVHLLSARPALASRQIVLRVVRRDGSFDYQFLTLSRNPSGEITSVDCEIATAGSLRDILRGIVTRFAPYEGPDGKIAREAPNAEQLIFDKRVLAGMHERVREGKQLDVLNYYNHLSDEYQTDRYPLLITAKAVIDALCEMNPDGQFARSLDGSVQALADRFRKHYPNDAVVEFLLIDRHIHLRSYQEALNSIDALDAWVGGDPYLDTIRASLHLQLGNLQTAREAAEQALQKAPEILHAYVVAAEVAVNQGDFQRVKQVEELASQRFGVDIDVRSDVQNAALPTEQE